MSLRPSLRKNHSSPNSSFDPSTNPSPSSSLLNLVSVSGGPSSHISIQLPGQTETHSILHRPNMEHKPHSALVGGSSHHSSSDLPRTRTWSSGQGTDQRYRRKVGFEAFEAGPDALFAYTCQVSHDAIPLTSRRRVRGTNGREIHGFLR